METFYKGCAHTMLACILLFLSFLISMLMFDALRHVMGTH